MPNSLGMTPSRKLNIFQRALNRAGRSFGIAPFPVAWECESEEQAGEGDSVFETIANENYWGSKESISGPGSELARTAAYRRALLSFLERERIDSMFDAPCGDLNWMSEILAVWPLRYIGGDISRSVIALARKRHPSLDLREFDLCKNEFPDVTVWHCRDAFLHMSFADIWAVLERAANSSIQFAMLTTYRARLLRNLDIRTGGWRYIDLERPPFNLPPAMEYLDDSQPRDFPRAVGVWRIESIRQVINARRS